MALKNYRAPFDTILTGDEPTAVFGLTVTDIGMLMRDYGESCRDAYNIYAATEGTGDEVARIDRTLVELVHLVPDLVAAIIAYAAREPDAIDVAKSLPVTIQIDALVKVLNLTMATEGGLGNFLAVLRNATDSLKLAVAVLKAPPAQNATR